MSFLVLTTLAFFPLGAALVLLVILKDNVKVIYDQYIDDMYTIAHGSLSMASIHRRCNPIYTETTEWASTTGVTYVLGVDG